MLHELERLENLSDLRGQLTKYTSLIHNTHSYINALSSHEIDNIFYQVFFALRMKDIITFYDIIIQNFG